MSIELSIKINLSPEAIAVWIHGPWYSDLLYEGMYMKHGMVRERVDAGLSELRKEGLIQSRFEGEPEVCIDTHRGTYLKNEFCSLAGINSPPDHDAAEMLIRLFQPPSKGSIELYHLPFSARTIKALIAGGITTADAIPESNKDLLQIPGFGLLQIQEISAWRKGRENWAEFYKGGRK